MRFASPCTAGVPSRVRRFGRFKRFLAAHAADFHADGAPGSGMQEGGAVYAAMVDSGDMCNSTAALYHQGLRLFQVKR